MSFESVMQRQSEGQSRKVSPLCISYFSKMKKGLRGFIEI